MFKTIIVISLSTMCCCDAAKTNNLNIYPSKARNGIVKNNILPPPKTTIPQYPSSAISGSETDSGTLPTATTTTAENKPYYKPYSTQHTHLLPTTRIIHHVMKDISSKGNRLLTCIQKTSKKKIMQINIKPPLLTEEQQRFPFIGKLPQKIKNFNQEKNNSSTSLLRRPTLDQWKGELFHSLSSIQCCASGLRRNVFNNNDDSIQIPITDAVDSSRDEVTNDNEHDDDSSSISSRSNVVRKDKIVRNISTMKSKKMKKEDQGENGEKQTKRRKNNTGFYYGIQDDVFFKDTNDEEEELDLRETKIPQPLSPSSSSNNRHIDREESIRSSTLNDMVGETLVELREMREDIMALREEMHYMKEEMRRNNRMRLPNIGDEEYEENEYSDEQQHQYGSMAENVRRRQKFDQTSRDIETWAHKLLFEEDNEENGWKEVICNKMVRSKFNKDGSTKCYIKWMKDSRKLSQSTLSKDNNDNQDTEYPCIKCYTTLNAPIDQVCDYLSRESNMSEYNDLVISYKDLEDISPQSKICWSRCPQILFIKPRDFVTYCHHRWRKDGTQIVVNQACEHPDAPGNEDDSDGKICRAHALRGANFISKDPDDSNRTRMAILAHADPGGGIPQWAMKTAVNAVAPIEPFKLFHKINTNVCACANNKKEFVNNLSGDRQKPAGLSQLGYACFWPCDEEKNE